jgi:hypothetical protein
MNKHGFLFLLLTLPLASCSGPPKELSGAWVRDPDSAGGEKDFLQLEEDGKFMMGGIDGKRNRYLGITGTWSVSGEKLFLFVKESETCKIPENEALRLVFLLSEEKLHLQEERDGQEYTAIFRRPAPGEFGTAPPVRLGDKE